MPGAATTASTGKGTRPERSDMASQPMPALLLLLLVVLLLSEHTRMEPTDTAPTPTPARAPAQTPDRNSSAGQPLPGIELKAAAHALRPAPRPLALLAPFIPLAPRLVLG